MNFFLCNPTISQEVSILMVYRETEPIGTNKYVMYILYIMLLPIVEPGKPAVQLTQSENLRTKGDQCDSQSGFDLKLSLG